MKVKTFTVNPFAMNCYVYFDEQSKQGVIIDPGAYTVVEKQQIEKFIKDNKINIKLILNTHGHIDHIMGNDWAKRFFSVPIMMHNEDLLLIERAVEQGEMFGVTFPQPPKPDKLIDEKDEIKFSGTVLKILHTPGHSPGSICFIDEKEKIIFAGDTLFSGSIGRTDLWMGDYDLLISSIKNKILKYGDDYKVYAGHLVETTIGEERKNNPFLK